MSTFMYYLLPHNTIQAPVVRSFVGSSRFLVCHTNVGRFGPKTFRPKETRRFGPKPFRTQDFSDSNLFGPKFRDDFIFHELLRIYFINAFSRLSVCLSVCLSYVLII